MAVACQTVDIFSIGNIDIIPTPPEATIWLSLHGQILVDQEKNTQNTVPNLVVGGYDIKLVFNKLYRLDNNSYHRYRYNDLCNCY